MNKFQLTYEELKVQGKDLVEQVRTLIHEGNIRRITLKDEKGNTFLEIPLTIAAIGAMAAPILAGVGAIAALVSHFTIVIERSKEKEEAASNDAAATDPASTPAHENDAVIKAG